MNILAQSAAGASFHLLMLCILVCYSTNAEAQKLRPEFNSNYEDQDIIIAVTNGQEEPLSDWSRVPLGEPIHFTFTLRNNSDYISIMPYSGSLKDRSRSLSFINSNECPDNYTIQTKDAIVDIGKRNQAEYYMDFLAYSLSSNDPHGRLDFQFSFYVCPPKDISQCYKECWGSSSQGSSEKYTPMQYYTSSYFDFHLWIVDEWNRTFNAFMNVTDSKGNVILNDQSRPYGEEIHVFIAPPQDDEMFEGLILEYCAIAQHSYSNSPRIPIIQNYCPANQTWQDIDFVKGNKSTSIKFRLYPVGGGPFSTVVNFWCKIILCVHWQDCYRDCWSNITESLSYSNTSFQPRTYEGVQSLQDVSINTFDDVHIKVTDKNGKELPWWPEVKLGDQLHVDLSVTGLRYHFIVPQMCEFNDLKYPQGLHKTIINNKCPANNTLDHWDGIVDVGKTNHSHYYIDFRAYSLYGKVDGVLGLSCNILMCSDWQDCYQDCWGNSSDISEGSNSSKNRFGGDTELLSTITRFWIMDKYNTTDRVDIKYFDSHGNFLKEGSIVPLGEEIHAVIALYPGDQTFVGLRIYDGYFTDSQQRIDAIVNGCPVNKTIDNWSNNIKNVEIANRTVSIVFYAYPMSENMMLTLECGMFLCLYWEQCIGITKCSEYSPRHEIGTLLPSEKISHKSFTIYIAENGTSSTTYSPPEFTTGLPRRTTHTPSKLSTRTPADPCTGNKDYVQNVTCRADVIYVKLNNDSGLFCYDRLTSIFGIFSRSGAGCNGSIVHVFLPWEVRDPGFVFSMVNNLNANCTFEYTTIYGAHGHPEAYGTTQYFYAQAVNISTDPPAALEGAEQYDFNVYCMFPSETRVSAALQLGQNVGNRFRTGQVVDPSQEVTIEFFDREGEKIDRADLGHEVRAAIGMKYGSDSYDSVVPFSCYFTADQDDDFGFRVPVIENGCPNTEVLYNWNVIKAIEKQNNRAYLIDFEAFSLSDPWQGTLFLVCDLTMCLEKKQCEKSCWNREK